MLCLHRQGNPRILEHLRGVVERRGLRHTVVLLSEVCHTQCPDLPRVTSVVDDTVQAHALK